MQGRGGDYEMQSSASAQSRKRSFRFQDGTGLMGVRVCNAIGILFVQSIHAINLAFANVERQLSRPQPASR